MPRTDAAAGAVRPQPSSAAAPREAPFVALDDVSMSYGGDDGTPAIDGVTLRIGRGEFVAVVGPSGR
jgi:ABC-type multidrug transport system fused ATPase/permease subunit